MVGFSDLPGDTTDHAFLWQSGVMTDLGTLPGDFSSFATGINENAQVVGASCDINGNCRAFLWESGVMTDLNTLAPDSPLFLLFAFAINDPAQLAGLGLNADTGELHAYLATSVQGSDSVGPAARGAIRQRPRVTLPESVRELLQRRLGLGRFGPRLMRP